MLKSPQTTVGTRVSRSASACSSSSKRQVGWASTRCRLKTRIGAEAPGTKSSTVSAPRLVTRVKAKGRIARVKNRARHGIASQ